MNDFLDKKRIKIIEENLGLKLTAEQVSAFNKWSLIFTDYNSHTNLMSRNEIKNLFEKHVYDSLSIVLWKNFARYQDGGKLLDIGTGGGFPSVMLALCFPSLTVFANDSRIKKINFIKLAKRELDLTNLNILYGRAEEISPVEADIVTFRAVGKIKDIFPLAERHTAQGGGIVFYKAKDVETEIREASRTFKNLKPPEIIPYTLPLDVENTRNLVVFSV